MTVKFHNYRMHIVHHAKIITGIREIVLIKEVNTRPKHVKHNVL